MDLHATQGVTLNDFRVDYPWWESQYPDNLYFDNWEREGFVECDPAPGCMVIMQVESDKWNHAGIITEDGELLHHLYGQPSCITPYARGYFKDRTMICVRHKDLPQEIKPWRAGCPVWPRSPAGGADVSGSGKGAVHQPGRAGKLSHECKKKRHDLRGVSR